MAFLTSAEPRYRQMAEQLQTEISQHHPATQAATLLEALVRTKAPIVQDSSA